MLGLGLTVRNENFTFGNWNIVNAANSTKSFDVSLQETTPREVVFSVDGTKFYVIGNDNNAVFQYTLTIPFDVSTATYSTKSKDISAQETSCSGVVFSYNGLNMYVVGFNTDAVYQYALSTAWDVSSATYATKSLDVSNENSGPQEVCMNVDGSKVFTLDFTTSTVFQYTLSTPFDLSSGSYESKSKDVSAQEASCQGLAFNGLGTKMYIVGTGNDTVFQYTLTTAWDVSSATYDTVSFDISAQETTPRGLNFNIHGTKLYVVGSDNGTVYQYDI